MSPISLADNPVGLRPPSTPRFVSGFTIIEVLVAIGVFSVAVVMSIAMLGNSLQSETAVGDLAAAKRLVGSINAKLASYGYDVVQGTSDTTKKNPFVPQTGLLFDAGQDPNSVSDISSSGSKVLYASRRGDKIGTYNDPIWGGTTAQHHAQKYFEIMLIRLDQNGGLSPRPDDGTDIQTMLNAAAVGFTVRISWPAFDPVTGLAPKSEDRAKRSSLIFNAALAR